MKGKIYSDTTITLLEKIAKYSGFSSTPGLLNGKTGIAILLYHGSRCFNSPQYELVADALIEDITEETERINSLGFTKGLSGIAWGVNHLMSNGFIDFDAAFFEDIDRILFCDKEATNRIDKAEYSFLGLYILSRYDSSSDKSYWIVRANVYCSQMKKLLGSKENLYTENPVLIIPFLYCLLKWKEYDLPVMNKKIIGDVFYSLNKINCRDTKTINNAFANQLYQMLLKREVSVQLPEILTITDINTIYLNKLLYSDIFLFPKETLDKSFSLIIADKLLLKDLVMLLNPNMVGLSEYISGFTWALLQYNQTKEY